MVRNLYLGYFTIASAVFCVWFALFLVDKTTPKNHLISWIVLLIAPLFWPIVLPLSIKELITKARNKRNRADSIQLKEAIINFPTNKLNIN